MRIPGINSCENVNKVLLSAAERRGTPVLLSASVSDNSGNSPQHRWQHQGGPVQ